jgi:MFS family permease
LVELAAANGAVARPIPPAVEPPAPVDDIPVEIEERRVAPWKRPFLALQQRDFRNLWLGMLPGTLAMTMGQVTNGYLAFDITGSATAVGFVTLGFGVPMLLLSLLGGVVADRFPKRQILIASQTTVGISSLILAVLVITGVIEIWMMTLTALLMGISFAFNMPARQAFVAELVERRWLTNAVALNNSGMNASRVIGPSIAGALIGVSFIGIGGVFVLMAMMYVIVVASLFRLPNRPSAEGARDRSGASALLDGLRYMRGNPVLSALILLGFAPVLLGMPYQALMPVFAKDVFGVGAQGLGLLMTVNGIGALAGSLAIAGLGRFERRGLLQMGLGITFGISIAVFAFSQSLWVAMLMLPVIGGASAAYMSVNSTLIMDYAEPAYRGRVMSVNMLTFALMPLSVVPFGALTDAFGAPLPIGIAGLLLALHPRFRHVR